MLGKTVSDILLCKPAKRLALRQRIRMSNKFNIKVNKECNS